MYGIYTSTATRVAFPVVICSTTATTTEHRCRSTTLLVIIIRTVSLLVALTPTFVALSTVTGTVPGQMPLSPTGVAVVVTTRGGPLLGLGGTVLGDVTYTVAVVALLVGVLLDAE